MKLLGLVTDSSGETGTVFLGGTTALISTTTADSGFIVDETSSAPKRVHAKTSAREERKLRRTQMLVNKNAEVCMYVWVSVHVLGCVLECVYVCVSV